MSGLQVVRYPRERRLYTPTQLRELAESFATTALKLDPEFPHYDADEEITDSTEHARGFAAGLRESAAEILRLIGIFSACSNCEEPIIDPWNLPENDPHPLCLECAPPG